MRLGVAVLVLLLVTAATQNPQALLQSAEEELAAGRNHKALAILRQAVVRDSEYVAAHILLAGVARADGLWQEAFDHYDRVLQLEPDQRLRRYRDICAQALTELEQQGYVDAKTLLQSASSPVATRSLELAFDLAQVPLHIKFGTGKHAVAELMASSRQQLEQAALVLDDPAWRDKPLAIEGHTCTCGASEDNARLAQRRAEAVRDFLVGRKIIAPQQARVIAHGEERPIAASPHEYLPPAECNIDVLHSLDRRVIIRLWRDAEEETASAQVSFLYRPRGSQGTFRPLEEGEILRSKDELKLVLHPDLSVYAYVFHRGADGQWLCLFPNAQVSSAQNPLAKDRQYELPEFVRGIPLGGQTGREQTFVYLSEAPDPEMEVWIGDPQRLEAVLSQPQATEATSAARGKLDIFTPETRSSEIDWHAQVRFDHQP